MNLLSVALEFTIAVLLAFAGFTMRAIVVRLTEAHAGVQALRVAVAGIVAQLEDLGDRISRLERTQDQDTA